MNDDTKHVTLAQSVKQMHENLPALMDFERLQARMIRARYIALVGQGFTEQQAIELCKKP